MSETQIDYSGFIGVDVSKDSITVHDSRTGRTEEIDNRSAALHRYGQRLDPHCLVVCEPTGGHEHLLLNSLTRAGIPVHRADARKVKAFIRSHGVRGKTDAIDAKALAQYGRERHPRLPLWQPPDAARMELKALVARRQDLVAAQIAEKNRCKAPTASRRIRQSCKRMLTLIERELAELQAAIDALVAADDRLRKTHKILTGVTGVGPVVATTLIATMPELGTLTRRQAAALAGLAPHPKQSGKYQGYRRTTGGRPDVKKALFMAALVAARKNQTCNAFYTRLVENGKKPIVAITALMRKIITILNAKLRDHFKEMQMS